MPWSVWTAKKPSPVTAKSSGSPVSFSGCGVKSVTVPVTWTAVVWVPIVRAGHGVREQQASPNDCWVGAVGLVARRRRVGEVIGDLVLAHLLGEHAGGRDVEAAIHVVSIIGTETAILEAMIDPIAVAAALLRTQMPDVTLRQGSTLVARVASRGEQHAVIVLAGIPLTAQVPPDVQAGATLKLKVQEVTPERVVLQIDPQTVAAAPPPPLERRSHLAVEEPPGAPCRRRRRARRRGGTRVHLAGARPARPASGAARGARTGRSDDPGGSSTCRRQQWR